MSSKAVWRAQILERRMQIGPERAVELNNELSQNLRLIWAQGAKGQIWAGYKSFKWEANPEQAIAQTVGLFRWVFPKVEGLSLRFLEPPDKDAKWTKSSYDIFEPDPLTSSEVPLQACVGVLVPGVAFDRIGHRIGYGKGFYDRALAGYQGLKVGIGFSAQLVNEELPHEDHDILLDYIVTDKGIHKVNEV